MGVRLPALHSKHLYPLSQLTRPQRTITSKTLHIFSPPTSKHRCGISSVVDMVLKELWWKNLIASSDSGWEQIERPTAGTLSPKQLSSPNPSPQGSGNTEEEEKECFSLRRLKNMKSSSFLKEKNSYSAFLSISAPKGSFVSTKIYLSHMQGWQS